MRIRSYIKKISLFLGGISFVATLFSGNLKVYAAEELTGLSSMEIVSMMGKGYNIGNTLDAEGGKHGDIVGHETSWGNPQINKELIDGIANAGFKTVRIPCTWFRHIRSSDGTYDIDEDFLVRVKEVVDLCYDADLFVILNVHHENWVNVSDLDESYKQVGVELKRVWEQIADYFADYDQHLIFEGMNEPRAKGKSYEWNGTADCYDAVNYLDQVFVDAVRNNGKGHNPERALMVPGYAASSSTVVLKSIVLPTTNGVQDPNLIVSTHCYSPYDFCLTDNQSTFSVNNSGDTAAIKQLISDLKSLFIEKGVPAVIGECGCTNSGNNTDARELWFDYIGKITADNNIPAIVWDNGAGGMSGGECHRYIKRSTGEVVEPRLVNAFIYGKQLEAAETVIDFEPVKNGSQNTIYTPFELGFTNSKLSNQAKVNHTEGAPVGFALKVDKNIDNMEALYNMEAFKGKEVLVKAYISSKDADTVSFSIKTENGEYTELMQVDTSEEWTVVGAEINCPEKYYLSFKGNPDIIFYVDDICLSPKDEDGNYSFDLSELETISDSADDGSNSAESENIDNDSSEGVTLIGGADGPTSVFLAGKLGITKAGVIVGTIILLIIAGVTALVVSKKKRK